MNDIALNKPLRSLHNPDFLKTINDGNTETFWEMYQYPKYFDLDLLSVCQISHVELQLKWDAFPGSDVSHFTQFTIYGSVDNDNFFSVASYRKEDYPTNGIYKFDVNCHLSKIRVYIEYVSDSNKISVYNLSVFGKENYGVCTDKITQIEDFSASIFAAPITETEILSNVKGVIERSVGECDWFAFELVKSDGNDWFEIASNEKIHIKGNNGLSLVSGAYYYLKTYCGVEIGQQTKQVKLPDSMPIIDEKIMRTSPYKYRYAYNYCTHGYTMSYYDEAKWQSELDYLMLNGYNLVLDITAQEEVLRRFLVKLGYNNDDALEYISAEPYLAWQLMGNLDGLFSCANLSRLNERARLARKNQRFLRSMGAEIVLTGYVGSVPNDIKRIDSSITPLEQGWWVSERYRPAMIRTDSAEFVKYAHLFYEAQNEVFGQTTHFYSVDPFHEGGNSGDMSRAVVGKKVLSALRRYDENAVWVLQSWSLDEQLLSGFTPLEREENLLILDLRADSLPKHGLNDEFGGSSWVWCMLENFGGKIGLQGDFPQLSSLKISLQKHKHLKGIGMVSEGTNQNPALYDFFHSIFFENTEQSISNWTQNYPLRRYGLKSDNLVEAWKILQNSVYNIAKYKDGHIDPPPSLICYLPKFNFRHNYEENLLPAPYSGSELVSALKLLLIEYDKLKNNEGYKYDLVDITRQLLSNIAENLYAQFSLAYNNKNADLFKTLSTQFMDIIFLTDKVLSKAEAFRFSTWMESAKNSAKNKSDLQKDVFLASQSCIVTAWNPSGKDGFAQTDLFDYANRQYSGLFAEYYAVRWKVFLERAQDYLDNKTNKEPQFSRFEAQKLAMTWIRKTDYNYSISDEPLDILVNLAIDKLCLIK